MIEKQNCSEKAGKSNQQPTGISMSPEQAVWFAVKLVHNWKTFKVFECKMGIQNPELFQQSDLMLFNWTVKHFDAV